MTSKSSADNDLYDHIVGDIYTDILSIKTRVRNGENCGEIEIAQKLIKSIILHIAKDFDYVDVRFIWRKGRYYIEVDLIKGLVSSSEKFDLIEREGEKYHRYDIVKYNDRKF